MGECFCSLDQTYSKCESTLVKIMSFRPRNRVTTKQKKVFTETWRVFAPEFKWRPKKKRFSPQFGTIFGRILWDLFVLTGPYSSPQPALKSQWGDAKSRWGDAKSRWGDANSWWGDASPLQFKYWLCHNWSSFWYNTQTSMHCEFYCEILRLYSRYLA